MAPQLRVGLVGVNAGRSWAKISHIPALRALPEFRIAAVATRKMTTATEAAEAFGALEAYDDFRALARSDQVDVVSVSVRVPFHLEVVTAALEARKHVICEWPLGRNVDEADKMAAMARAAGVHPRDRALRAWEIEGRRVRAADQAVRQRERARLQPARPVR